MVYVNTLQVHICFLYKEKHKETVINNFYIYEYVALRARTFRMAEVYLEQLIKLSSGSYVERGEELPELPNAGTCIYTTKENASPNGRYCRDQGK